MGLDIRVLRPIKKVDKSEDAYYIYSLNFPPIKHLTKFDKGYYECEEIESPFFHMSYRAYGILRRQVCDIALHRDIEYVWENDNEFIESPFIEFLNFSDNEGCFDYVVAEKLYKDFVSYKDKAKGMLDEYFYEFY